jgi:hypothetical protein
LKDFPITPEMVADAYRRTGIRPTRIVWYGYTRLKDSPRAACAVGVIIAARLGWPAVHRVENCEDAAQMLGVDVGQLEFFVAGFENLRISNPNEIFRLGQETARLVGL